MGVEIEVAVTPTDEESDGEEDDEDGDGGLRALLHPLWEVALGEQDRNAEEDERDAVADPPPCAEARSGSRGFPRPDVTSVVIAAM